MAILTIVLFVSMAFALGDAMIRPKTPCERARDAAIIGAYIPTCDHAGQYTPKQCFGSTGKHGRTYTLNSPIQLNVIVKCATCLFLVGYCWCVTITGQKIQGTETPPGTAINC
uniref:Thyroglobulin type-1 domain-containing protein n=2 Tax=Hucho hucho TaxID=62062 RepID=A0A4W5QXT7_9TELE